MKSEGHAEVALYFAGPAPHWTLQRDGLLHEQGRTDPDDMGLEELALPLAWWDNSSGLG